jgi:inner membrane protease subunit 1
MLPTLSHTGDFVLISPIPLHFHTSAAQRNGLPPSATESWGIKRGDVVIATSPTDPGKTVCKRIVGMEGDIIEVDPSRTSERDRRKREEEEGEHDPNEGKRWEEIDADHRRRLSLEKQAQANRTEDGESLVPVFPQTGRLGRNNDHVRIPKGYIWLAGDNLSNSTDSRAYGPVPLAMLKGKVLARVSAWNVQHGGTVMFKEFVISRCGLIRNGSPLKRQ